MQGGRPGVTPNTEKVPVDKPTENSICSYREAHIVCPCTENSPDGRGDFYCKVDDFYCKVGHF